MRRSLALFSAKLITATLALSWASGCLPVDDLDLTQPNKVKKTLFTQLDADGNPAEWFLRQTIIDVPATATATFIGEQSSVERIVWEVEEDYLFAYRAYPWLEAYDGSADGYVRPGTGAYRGAPIAAYGIVAHFDVVRDFNPATGEQTNVIRENMTNRPWFERDYMRIDWSDNLISDFQFIASNVKQQTAYYVPNDNENELGDMSKDGLVLTEDYIDIVTAITITPEVNALYSDYYGFTIPECWLGNVEEDCLGGNLKVRSSFLKAKPSTYVTQEFDDIRFRRFGYFRSERYGFDPEYGVVEPAVKRMSNRFNIWENAADCYDETADFPYGACSASDLKAIVYYLNEDFPEELKPGAISNGVEWNRVFKEAVLASTGWAESEIENIDMFVLCPNNPVKAGDHAACGYSDDAALNPNPQIGDLRYSMYYYIANQHASSPLGYGPSAQDPLTGETFQGNAFYYGGPGKWIAARTRDIIKLELGILNEDDISGGAPAVSNGAALYERNSSSESKRRLRADPSKVRDFIDNKDFKARAARLKQYADSGEMLHNMSAPRLQALKESGLDDFVMNEEIRSSLGHTRGEDTFMNDNIDMAKLFSPEFFRMGRDRENRLLNPKSGGCVLMAEDVFDQGLVGLTNTIRNTHYESDGAGGWQLKSTSSEEAVFNDIVMRTMQDTQLHEIGHTVGLRHNFSGSTDALNFGPEYWTLKGDFLTPAGAERPVGEWDIRGALETGMDSALANGLRDFQDSSVMDYASTYGTNTKLGSYDLAAIKYAYGDVVEVFTNTDWAETDADGNRTALTQERIDLMKQGEVHYTYLPEIVSNAATFNERVADMYARSNINFRKTDERMEQYDASYVEVPYIFCSDEYRGASASCFTWDQGVDTYERSTKMVEDYRNYYIFDAYKRQKVNFGWAFSYMQRVYGRKFAFLSNQYKQWVNDELIIRSDRPCVWYEGGVRRQSDRHSFDEQCGLEGFIGSAAGLNLLAEVLQTPDVGCYARLKPGCYQGEATNDTGLNGSEVTLVDADPDACIGATSAAPEGDDARLIRVTEQTAFVHVPDSLNCEAWDANMLNRADSANYEDSVMLGLGEGAKSQITNYDRDEWGYYFYNKALNIGHWWDKWAAVMALGDPSGRYIGTDASSDTRAYLINFLTIFGDDLNNLVGGIVAERSDIYGGSIVDKVNPTPDEPPKMFQPLNVVVVFNGDIPDRQGGGFSFVDPDQQYTFRLIALMNGAYSGYYTDDVEFGETLRLGMSLRPNEILVNDEVRADATRYAELTDPVTGQIWYAVNQVRDLGGDADDELFSTAFEMINTLKDKYYVGGAAGDGKVLIEDGFLWQPRSDIRMLNIIRSTANTFGYGTDIWSGTIFY
ncbi:MAG: hypothetical protein GY822_14770 [Deltaproteobacteria bacterium]|nr:hypothetical protein [Deltaproteobacteria bacterium]